MQKLNSRIAKDRHTNTTKSKCSNNITKKYITKKYMIGGSSNLAMPIPTLKTLITNTRQTEATIQYSGVKFKCLLGANNFIIGSIGSVNCIKISYNFEYKYAYLASFFYNKEKHECIGVSKEINNTNFKNNVKNNTRKTKKINKLCLTLIDIININLEIKVCRVGDTALIKIGEYSVPLLYKHIERGYGFYNEFGYLYNSTDDSKIQINNVAYANDCLQVLNTFFTQDKDAFEQSVFNKTYNKIYQYLLDSEEYKTSSTLRKTMTLIIENFKNKKTTDLILLYIREMIMYFFIEKQIVLNNYTKYYEYDNVNNKIFTTELDTKYSNQGKGNNTTYTLPYKFVLQEHKKQKITITHNTTDNLYQITIVDTPEHNNNTTKNN